jgi:hypothetical protein
MSESSENSISDSKRGQTAKLLSRGGRILAVAAMAHIDGQRPGQGPWHTLSPENLAAVEEVLYMLSRVRTPSVLEAVIRAAMAPEPATAAPKWAEPLWRNPALISRVGKSFDAKSLAPALGPKCADPSDREKGIAAIAIAMCRSSDGLQALVEMLPEEDGAQLMRMARLAHVNVEPKEPSTIRAEVRRLLKDEIVAI